MKRYLRFYIKANTFEYAVQVWNPYLEWYNDKIDIVQRRITRITIVFEKLEND